MTPRTLKYSRKAKQFWEFKLLSEINPVVDFKDRHAKMRGIHSSPKFKIRPSGQTLLMKFFSPDFCSGAPKPFLGIIGTSPYRRNDHMCTPEFSNRPSPRCLPYVAGPRCRKTKFSTFWGVTGVQTAQIGIFLNGNESRVNSAHFGVPMAKIDNGVNFWEQFEFSRFLAFSLFLSLSFQAKFVTILPISLPFSVFDSFLRCLWWIPNGCSKRPS